MGEESVKGANLGVILIIFAAILALGLIVFMLARNMANTGLTNVAEKLQSAEESEFTDFDGSVVVGQRVNAALNGFKGKKVAVLISTQGLIDKTVAKPYGVGLSDATDVMTKYGKGADGKVADLLDITANISGHEQMNFALALAPGRITSENNRVDQDPLKRKGLAVLDSSYKETQLMFVQYNTLLEVTEPNGVVVTDASKLATYRNSSVWWNDGHYVFDGSYRQADGRTLFDNIFANLTKTGFTEMVPGAARFNANLLKDANGVILGVVFQQIGY